MLDRTYFHGLRGPDYERPGAGNPTWYVYDGLGSVRGGAGISGSNHKFVGSLGHPSEDDAGLISKRARWMDPTTGTFTSEDPARDAENWFVDFSSNPTDKIGESGKSDVALAAHRHGLILLRHAESMSSRVWIIGQAFNECFMFSPCAAFEWKGVTITMLTVHLAGGFSALVRPASIVEVIVSFGMILAAIIEMWFGLLLHAE